MFENRAANDLALFRYAVTVACFLNAGTQKITLSLTKHGTVFSRALKILVRRLNRTHINLKNN